MMRTIIVCLLFWVVTISANAQSVGEAPSRLVNQAIDNNYDTSLTLEGALLPSQVLESSAARFPEILEALARENAARGDRLAANGAFDLVFKADGFDRVTGFWSGRILNTQVQQNLKAYGAQVYGGYRISDGTFPVYEDINFTDSLGEFKVGALFSLLRNRSFDQRRFSLTDTRLASEQASLDVQFTKLGVQLKALNAYWRWVATGQDLRIYTELLKIAQDREVGLEEQVRKGALPEIAIVENQQNIISREIRVAEADRNFAVAANALSFYLRDQSGRLITPNDRHLPNQKQLPELIDLENLFQANPDDVLANRPELNSLRLAINRVQNKARLGKNELKPDLTFNVEVSRDIGRIAEGGISRDSTDTIVGFRFSVPLQRREARGRLQRAKAELRAAELRQQRTEDKILIELNNILLNLSAALRLSILAENEVEQANLMVNAEQKKFSRGASDFFLVNIREERAADAQIRANRAILNGRLAQTSYNAATMNMNALGLEPLNSQRQQSRGVVPIELETLPQ